ncbi:MAG: transferase [Cyanobacteria bacterium J06621_8]
MIYLPPPQPNLNKEIRISGDVEIHPTASLAPGVILQAASDSRIIVGADACIGMGVIITACGGSVEIGNGAILGAGVLIIGQSRIGNNSCIGTSSTIFRRDVDSMEVIEPGSIIGDASRSPQLKEEEHEVPRAVPEVEQFPKNNFNNGHSVASSNTVEQPPKNNFNNGHSVAPSNTRVQSESPQGSMPKTVPEQSVPANKKAPIVGQVYINELLVTLFPHKKELDSR